MDISDIVKPIGHRGAKAALEALPRMPRALLSRPDPQTREFMALYNALRDQGMSIGYTDGRDFRIRALNAAGKSGWSNVVRPFRVGEACVGAVGLGAQAGKQHHRYEESVHVATKTWRRRSERRSIHLELDRPVHAAEAARRHSADVPRFCLG